MVNKKGQSSTITVIIAIAIGVAVLIFLIWGFTRTGSDFLARINPFTSGSNVESIKSSCELACSRGDSGKFDYCNEAKTLKLSSGNIKGSCHNFYEDESIRGQVGFAPCSMSCDTSYKQTCNDLGGKWKGACGENEQLVNPSDLTGKGDSTSSCCAKKIV